MLSLITLAKIKLAVPDYTTLCRRRKLLEVMLPRQAKGRAIHLAVDSTGLKVYGEGEWKARQHGVTKRRTWRKSAPRSGRSEQRDRGGSGNDEQRQ